MSDIEGLDRRVSRTKAALWEALRALLQEYGWADISIKRICDTAGVARSSFYAHFETKADLLSFGYWQVAAEIPRSTPAGAQGFATTTWIVDHITTNPGFFTKVAKLGTSQFLFAQFTQVLEQVLAEELEAKGRAGDRQAVVFAVSGGLALVRLWLDEKQAEDPEHLKARLNDLVARALGQS